MLSTNYIQFQRKIVSEVQKTEIEKLADSFKLAWFTLPDSFKIPRNPCQTVLNFFGFLFTPVIETIEKNIVLSFKSKVCQTSYLVIIQEEGEVLVADVHL